MCIRDRNYNKDYATDYTKTYTANYAKLWASTTVYSKNWTGTTDWSGTVNYHKTYTGNFEGNWSPSYQGYNLFEKRYEGTLDINIPYQGTTSFVGPSTGDVQVMATGLIGPNGLCFSPNFDKLYIADSGSTDPRSIFVYDVTDNGTSLSRGRIFRETGSDSTDGIRCDIDGNLWASSQRGTNSISVYSPEAQLIGRIHLPEMPSNLTFGGMKKNRLFITASQSVYSIYTGTKGASLG